MTQTIADSWREEGKAEGLEKGRAEGRAEGQTEGQVLAYRDTLKRLLALRFPSLPEEIARRIDQVTDIERLKMAIERVLSLSNPEELGL